MEKVGAGTRIFQIIPSIIQFMGLEIFMKTNGPTNRFGIEEKNIFLNNIFMFLFSFYFKDKITTYLSTI